MILKLYSVGCMAATLFYTAPQPLSTSPASPAKATYFSSDWEEVKEWKKTTSGSGIQYNMQRETPQLDQVTLAKGAVVVFVKGYDFSGFSKNEKPMGLPFYFMAPEENSGTYNWESECQQGRIQVAVRTDITMEDPFTKGGTQIKMRYFVLSPEFLKQHHLNANALRGISYTQLTSLLGLSPQA